MKFHIAQLSPRHFISLVITSAFVLSLSHHRINFWGLPWQQQIALILLAVPAAAFLITKLLERIWDRFAGISRKRWTLFLVPAVALAAIIAWRIFTPPVVWHTLEIVAPGENGENEVQLLEVKDSQGRRVRFSDIKELGSWTIRDNLLVSTGVAQNPLRHSFLGRIDKPVVITFKTSPQDARVDINVDGRTTRVDLDGEADGHRGVVLNVGYRFGLSSWIVVALVYLLDFFALLFLFAFFWVTQEIIQIAHAHARRTQSSSSSDHRKRITILLIVSGAIHIINYLAVPLIVVGDSASYLNGAVHWVNFFNFDGVRSETGPGMAMLFIPTIWLFGRNPWALKAFLHLLAIGCVPLGYLLGWQVSGKRWFASIAGMVVVLTPDLYLYSNLVMSEIPNIFLGLLFLVCLVQALRVFSMRWLMAALMVASLNVLARPENIIMMGTCGLLLTAKGILGLRSRGTKVNDLQPNEVWRRLGVTFLLGLIPLLWWSARNYQVHGFFDLTNHAPRTLYDGWIYFGESSRIAITDPDSVAAKAISSVYVDSSSSVDDTDAPTSGETYSALVRAGYTSQEAFALIQQVAIDSILRDLSLTVELFFLKLHDGFVPEAIAAFTHQDENPILAELKSVYFDEEILKIDWAADLQRGIYQIMEIWYGTPYQVWTWICLAMLMLSLYRYPFFLWFSLGTITAIRILLPTALSLPHWRYILAGIVPLQIIALFTIYSLISGARLVFQPCRKVA
jgi:hypothetical protein